ncbi:MAG: mechanosensitive ion channel family protein [Steroidobacteraceae bacterium]|jgi:hypothetical protein
MRSLWTSALFAAGSLWVTAGQAADVKAAAAPAAESWAVLTADQVIRILDDTVDWYRTLGAQQQSASQPSDLLILYANRQTADKVMALAFDIARANAELLSSEAGAAQRAAGGSSPQALGQQQDQLDAERRTIAGEVADYERRPAGSTKALKDRLAELRGELAMVDARRNLLQTMSEFVNQSDPKSAGANALKAQIDAIAATIPTAGANPAATVAAAVPAAARAAGSGLWELGSNVLKLRGKVADIDSIDRRTAALAQTFKEIGAAPVNQLKSYGSRSDALASEAQHASGEVLTGLREQFDTLAWLYKQTASIVIPLAKEQILLRQYRHTLGSWRDATERQYEDARGQLGVRVAILLGILVVVFLIGEVWQRTVIRYVHDVHRRRQLILIRSIVVWTLAAVIVGLSFVTELSTFATFAGLLTAGLAVAMQSVLVSVVGYFFLIGKYGIRVGDRIQIGTVLGEVIDIGLVRMHLMELNSSGPLGPTGRVVAFANLIVFQASGGLFKQIPGVNLTWHEITLTLPAVADYPALKARLLSAVNQAIGEFHDEIVRQTRQIEKSTASAAADAAEPRVQMRLIDSRMEASIGYPVSVQHAAPIDERVSEALLMVITQNTQVT